jgi:hypothetical protein
MNRYSFRKGYETHADAQASIETMLKHGDLREEQVPKVVPYRWDGRYYFSIDVIRT